MNARLLGMMLGVLAAAQATADDSGVYIGAGVGQVDTPDNAVLGVPEVPLLTGRTRDTQFTPAVQLGYRFNRNIAVELGYVDLGDVKANVVDASGSSDASAQLKFSADGISLALLGVFPIGNWEPYVKAGVLFSSTTLKYAGSIGGNAFAASLDNDAEDALYGLGVRYNLTETFKLSLDSTYFVDVGEPDRGQGDFLRTSVGVVWQF